LGRTAVKHLLLPQSLSLVQDAVVGLQMPLVLSQVAFFTRLVLVLHLLPLQTGLICSQFLLVPETTSTQVGLPQSLLF
jgi:hypothetical protein